MALIRYDSASSAQDTSIGGGNSSHTLTWTHTPASDPYNLARNEVAIVISNVSSNNISGTTVNATYGGVSMTNLTRLVYYTGGTNMIGAFYLLNPPSGNQTVVVTHSGMAFTAATRNITGIAALYSGVASASLGATSATPSSTKVSSSSVTASGLSPSSWVVGAHARDTNTAFSTFSQTQRQTVSATNFARLVLGDSTGGTSATSSVTVSSNDWIGSVAIVLNRMAETEGFL